MSIVVRTSRIKKVKSRGVYAFSSQNKFGDIERHEASTYRQAVAMRKRVRG